MFSILNLWKNKNKQDRMDASRTFSGLFLMPSFINVHKKKSMIQQIKLYIFRTSKILLEILET